MRRSLRAGLAVLLLSAAWAMAAAVTASAQFAPPNRPPVPYPPTLLPQVGDQNPVTVTRIPGAGVFPATEFELRAGTDEGGTDLGIFPMGLATSLTANAPYGLTTYLSVVGRNSFGPSLPSNTIEIRVRAPGMSILPPGKPTLTNPGYEQNPVTLFWAPGGGGAPRDYRLLVGSRPGEADLGTINMGSATSLTASIPLDRAFFVRVRAENEAGSDTSYDVSVVVQTPVPPAVPILNPPEVLGSTVRFTWGPPQFNVSTTLLARQSPDGPVVASAPVSPFTTTLTVPNVPAGTYYVSANATRIGLTTAESNQVIVVVP